MIGDTKFEKAMLDSGASINVMPYSVYTSLKLGPLNKTGIIIQLADKSNAYPKGVVEDVLVKIDGLIFPADFYVLDMGSSNHTTPILLGRPFLRTSKTKMDFNNGTLTMEFDDKIIKLNIYDSMKHSCINNHVHFIDVIDQLAQDVFKFAGKNEWESVINEHLGKEKEELTLNTELQRTVAALNDLSKSGNSSYFVLPVSNEKPLSFVLQIFIPDLKLHPSHYKYTFHGGGGTLPVIIPNGLGAPQRRSKPTMIDPG
jgi:hypothetical protein